LKGWKTHQRLQRSTPEESILAYSLPFPNFIRSINRGSLTFRFACSRGIRGRGLLDWLLRHRPRLGVGRSVADFDFRDGFPFGTLRFDERAAANGASIRQRFASDRTDEQAERDERFHGGFRADGRMSFPQTHNASAVPHDA
jgi:hypothetical protein